MLLTNREAGDLVLVEERAGEPVLLGICGLTGEFKILRLTCSTRV